MTNELKAPVVGDVIGYRVMGKTQYVKVIEISKKQVKYQPCTLLGVLNPNDVPITVTRRHLDDVLSTGAWAVISKGGPTRRLVGNRAPDDNALDN